MQVASRAAWSPQSDEHNRAPKQPGVCSTGLALGVLSKPTPPTQGKGPTSDGGDIHSDCNCNCKVDL